MGRLLLFRVVRLRGVLISRGDFFPLDDARLPDILVQIDRDAKVIPRFISPPLRDLKSTARWWKNSELPGSFIYERTNEFVARKTSAEEDKWMSEVRRGDDSCERWA